MIVVEDCKLNLLIFYLRGDLSALISNLMFACKNKGNKDYNDCNGSVHVLLASMEVYNAPRFQQLSSIRIWR